MRWASIGILAEQCCSPEDRGLLPFVRCPSNERPACLWGWNQPLLGDGLGPWIAQNGPTALGRQGASRCVLPSTSVVSEPAQWRAEGRNYQADDKRSGRPVSGNSSRLCPVRSKKWIAERRSTPTTQDRLRQRPRRIVGVSACVLCVCEPAIPKSALVQSAPNPAALH